MIAPAVAKMRDSGLAATGPLPADTIFVRARKGEFDVVLTMYHDQGQIAMKLLGFDQGVTLMGGYSVPICTPAHGTAYDIAGKGVADLKAARNAITLAGTNGAWRSGVRSRREQGRLSFTARKAPRVRNVPTTTMEMT